MYEIFPILSATLFSSLVAFTKGRGDSADSYEKLKWLARPTAMLKVYVRGVSIVPMGGQEDSTPGAVDNALGLRLLPYFKEFHSN